MGALKRGGGLVKASGLAALAALVVILAMATPAAAANGTVVVTPTTVAAGGTIVISGSVSTTACPLPDGVTITSLTAVFPEAGFGPTVSRNASGAFSVTYTLPTSTPPGTYNLGMRCGGGNVGVGAALQVTAQVAQVPVAAPQAGLGGASHRDGHAAVWATAGGVALGLGALLAFAAWRRRLVG
jgi:type 1 fimbria pilin